MTENGSNKVELVVMASGSAEPALDFVAAAFEKETGHKISISYRYDLDECDVLIMSDQALEKSPQVGGFAGRVEEGPLRIARTSGIGVAVRQGAKAPDVSTEQAIIQAIFDAERVLLTEHHNSGVHMQKFLKDRGIYERVKAKLRFASIGQDLVDRLLSGEGNEIMFLPIGRMQATNDPRLVILGPLPGTMQMFPEFFAVPMTSSTHKETAWDFARFCSGPGKATFLAHGFT